MAKRSRVVDGNYTSSSSDEDSESSPSSSSSSSSEEEEAPIVQHVDNEGASVEDGSKPEVMDVEFEFFDARPSDFHALRQYLASYLDGADFDVGGLAALICEQVAVGTMVKSATETPEQEHPVAFISVVNLHKHKNLKCIQQVKEYITSRCPKESKQTIQKLFDDSSHRLGLVVQERLVNTPPELVPSLHQCLNDDLEWAARNVGEEHQYDTLLWLERADCTRPTPAQTLKRKKKKAKKKSPETSDSISFQRFEMELYNKAAYLRSTFPCYWTETSLGRKRSEKRCVVAFKRSQLSSVCGKMQHLLSSRSLSKAMKSATR